MEDDKSKLDTIRDDEHLRRIKDYLNDLQPNYLKSIVDDKRLTEIQKQRMNQEITIIWWKLTLGLSVKEYPYTLKFDDPFTMEVLGQVLCAVEKEG
jgi:hypothetical protein